MDKKQEKRVGAVISLILCAIFIPVIFLNTVMIVKTYTDPEHLPGVFGIKPAIVLSGSMSPLFEAESLIFVKEADVSTLKEGDVICYLTGGTAITHRIEQIITKDGQVSYVTKGDANNTADRLAVSPAQVEGVYIGKIDGAGGFAMFMQSTTGMILFIVLPIVVYLCFDILGRRKDGQRDKRRAAELEAELAALKAERRK